MKTPPIYVDTSVLRGCFDQDRSSPSGRTHWSATSARGGSSPAVRPPRGGHAELEAYSAEVLTVSTDALELLAAYEAHSVLGPRYRADMLHIALATVANADLLVSWNFKHIVRFDKIRLFNGASLEQGYKQLAIHSPREVTTDGHERDSND